MTPPPRVRVLLADDHLLVRAGIRKVLEDVPGVEVVGEAGDGHEVLEQAERRAPDVILLDVALPRMNGLEAAARLARERPAVRIVMLSMHANQEYVSQALRVGAAGYLLKDSTVPELELALRAVMRGETYLSPAVSRHVIEAYVRSAETDSPLQNLTPRQREVLKLIAEGGSTRDIAQRLGVSVKTVESHRAHLMDRLGIRDVAGLVKYAIRTGLVNPDR
jgi:DNA-binding NarL/FixJ family response regulator